MSTQKFQALLRAGNYLPENILSALLKPRVLKHLLWMRFIKPSIIFIIHGFLNTNCRPMLSARNAMQAIHLIQQIWRSGSEISPELVLAKQEQQTPKIVDIIQLPYGGKARRLFGI